MSKDFTIQLRRDGNDIGIKALCAPPLPEAGEDLEARTVLTLSPEKINSLRFGDAGLQVVDQVTKQVSDWLLGPDLKPKLESALSVLSPQQKLRLIFYIEKNLRADPAMSEALSDLPFELLKLPGHAVPLVLNPQVSAILHQLDKVPFAAISTTQRTPPLRVLIVHANPKSLGGLVPDPVPIRNEILELGAGLGPQRVEVDILSRVQADGVVGLPTRPGLWKRLHDAYPPYDILVYLGHGGRDQKFQDLAPIAFLRLEKPDGDQPDDIFPDVLAGELQNHPIPVVLLVGCLTAANVPANEIEGLKDAIPAAMRGNQGVAQALVNSSSGVQFAVGMRFRLETNDAQSFLSSFFRSLLKHNPGNVEAAVHLAREELNAISPFKGSPASPVVFRVLSEEPMFEWLIQHDLILPDSHLLHARDILWRRLARQSAQNLSAVESFRPVLDELQDEIIADLRTRAPAIVVPWKDAAPGDTVKLPIALYGQLELRELEGKLIVDGADAAIEGLDGTAALRTAGLRLMREVDGGQAYFRIQPRSAAPAKLADGPIMEAQVKLGPTPGLIYPLTLEILEREPAHPLSLLNNAVIVPS